MSASGPEQAALKPGKTRRDVERVAHVDGGLAQMFKRERYVLQSSAGAAKVLKVDIEFRGNPKIGPQAGDVVVLHVSSPYWQPPYFD